MNMKNTEIFIALLFCTSLVHGFTKEEECEYDYSFDEECLPNQSEYDTCAWNPDKYQYVTKRVVCTKPRTKCTCYTSYEYKWKCECINSRKTPNFPSSGIIRWSGKAEIIEYPDVKTYMYVGEARKDANGNFLVKKTNNHHMPYWGEPPAKKMEFEIVIRNGSQFTKVSEVEKLSYIKFEISTSKVMWEDPNTDISL